MIVAALLLAAAQSVPAPAPAPAVTTPAARLNLDTPVETIMADPKGKAVMDAHLPQLAAHPSYEMAKSMSLNQIKGFAPTHLSDALLAKIAIDLAAVK